MIAIARTPTKNIGELAVLELVRRGYAEDVAERAVQRAGLDLAAIRRTLPTLQELVKLAYSAAERIREERRPMRGHGLGDLDPFIMPERDDDPKRGHCRSASRSVEDRLALVRSTLLEHGPLTTKRYATITERHPDTVFAELGLARAHGIVTKINVGPFEGRTWSLVQVEGEVAK